MRTVTERPFLIFSTRTFVPKGSVLWAAVSAFGLARSPDAVLDVKAYQEALPHWAAAFPWSVVIETATTVATAKRFAGRSMSPPSQSISL
jgi:hypothetical protein